MSLGENILWLSIEKPSPDRSPWLNFTTPKKAFKGRFISLMIKFPPFPFLPLTFSPYLSSFSEGIGEKCLRSHYNNDAFIKRNIHVDNALVITITWIFNWTLYPPPRYKNKKNLAIITFFVSRFASPQFFIWFDVKKYFQSKISLVHFTNYLTRRGKKCGVCWQWGGQI